jgi:two-component system CheB/CheR fusion protein
MARPQKEKSKANQQEGVCTSCPVVGIGASAGGLEAFKRFFDLMPPDSGMAFVLIQHLDPTHSSSTAELLARHTQMQVAEVEDRKAVEANHVYVIPPNNDLTIKEGLLRLTKPLAQHGLRMPVDFFFRSLAEDQQDNALCAILSGTGRDGTLGLEAIKGGGGMVLAQLPETAQFDGMPRSAIGTGLVDYAVPIEEMPDILLKHVRYAQQIISPEAWEYDELHTILSVLKARTRYDFNCYKKGTLLRRIERRMGINHVERIEDYLQLLRENDTEASLLFRDLLIGVTGYFREPHGYQFLEQEIAPTLVQQKESSAVIRVWVPGCATGEEPYSIAILLLECIQALQKGCKMQIFASDIDERALSVARAGVYPENIAADVSPGRLREFFEKEGKTYRVGKQVRDAVVFAAQNLICDPPFSRLDLISCRNLLIYLEPEVQKKVIALFHCVLNEGGILFLGESETIGRQGDLFAPVSKRWRIYRRMEPTQRRRVALPVFPGMDRFHPAGLAAPPFAATRGNLGKLVQQALLQRFAPFAVLINRRHELIYVYGTSGEFLELTTGEPTQDLMSMVRGGLGIAVRGAVQEAMHSERQVTAKGQIRKKGSYCPVTVTVVPLKDLDLADGLFLVAFAEAPQQEWDRRAASGTEDVPGNALVRQLEAELQSTKDDLQGTIEELEASNEELKTSNDEVLSMNEEQQSTNEELETSKEELQSLNEELNTVNSQLQDKVDELAEINDDLANLLRSTDIATLLLDGQLCIKRFTPAARRIFKLIPSDVGRPIGDIVPRVSDSTLVEQAEAVLETLTPSEKEVHADDDCWYIQRVLPYRTEENRIEGVVATFVDVTRRKQAENALQRSKDRIELLLQSTGEAIYGVNGNGNCIFANTKFLAQLGYALEEILGRNPHQLMHHTRADGTSYPYEECFVYRCLTEGASFSSEDEIAWRKDGTSFPATYTAQPIIEDRRITGAVVVLRDISEAHALSRRLVHMARHDALTGLVNRREFEDRLVRVLETAKNDASEHALCYLDLDQFKVINDTCGHLAGDRLLRQLAGHLQGHIRQRDTLARLGGDEFGVLLERCELDRAEAIANALRDAVAAFRFLWEDKTHTIGVSIGVVAITSSSGTALDVLKAADSACYAAKEAGRNRVHLYHEQDTVLAARHGEMQWVARINRALEEERLRLYAQPITALDVTQDGRPICELLLRMQREDGGIIVPGNFLGAAERYNLTSKLDRWVIGRVFEWLAHNPTQTERVALFCINLSGQSLSDAEFLTFILTELKRQGIPADSICFEITETAAIGNLASASAFIHELKQEGCFFALDDFGTGLSSFGYLKTLPVEFLKISGVFVKDIADDAISLAMVKSINDIGQVMGKQTIAECAENEAILSKLREVGVNFAQGFALGKPQPLNGSLIGACAQ